MPGATKAQLVVAQDFLERAERKIDGAAAAAARSAIDPGEVDNNFDGVVTAIFHIVDAYELASRRGARPGRMRAAVALRLTPLLVAILSEGAADGSFSLTSPEGTADVFTALIQGLNEVAIRLFLGRRDGTVAFETVTATLAAYFEAFERILGIPPTSWPLLDGPTLRFWFG